MTSSVPRGLFGLGLVVAAVVTLAGCSGGTRVPEGYGDAWLSRMGDRLADLQEGQGGAGGRLEPDGAHRATASVVLESVQSGDWDVLAVCRSTATVRLDVHLFRHDRIGKELGTVDVACGATARLPITVPDGQGVVLDANSSDVSGRALWNAVIVRRGWEA